MIKINSFDLKIWIKRSPFVRIIDGIKKSGWYGRIVTNGTAGVDKIATDASKNTSAHKAEIKMALELCMEEAASKLKQGGIVDLGPLGKLYPTTKSPWVEDVKDLKLKDVELKIAYKPSKELEEFFTGTEKYWYSEEKDTSTNSSTNTSTNEESDDTPELIDTSTGTADTSTGTIDNNGGDDIPAGNG